MNRMITLRESVLIVLNTRMVGGIKYQREELGQKVEDKTEMTEWKTLKIVDDVDETKLAIITRSKMRSLVTRHCKPTVMGLVCTKDNEAELDKGLQEAEELAREFNEKAKTCRLGVIGVKFDVQSDNEQAARVIAGQIKQVVEDLSAAIKEADVIKIREVLASARGLDDLLPDKQGGIALSEAMRAARVAATTIKREVEKKARDIEDVRQELDLTPIESARAFFLDFSDDVDAGAAVPVVAQQVEIEEEEQETPSLALVIASAKAKAKMMASPMIED